jgi:hypothetical protein
MIVPQPLPTCVIAAGDLLKQRVFEFFVAWSVYIVDQRSHELVPLLFTECPRPWFESRYWSCHLSSTLRMVSPQTGVAWYRSGLESAYIRSFNICSIAATTSARSSPCRP